MTKTWEPNEAVKHIAGILIENTTEDQLSDKDAERLAKIIVKELESDDVSQH